MNTIKLVLAASSLIVASSVIACTGATDETGSSENAATADIDHMFKRPDGKFDVWCSDGSTHSAITAEEIRADQVCGGPATSSSGGTTNTCPAATVPAAATWKAPGAPSTACTAADLDAIQAAADAGGDFRAMQAAVAANQPCQACAFTEEAGPNWGPIVLAADAANDWVNWSACLARVPNGSDACGQAWHQESECVLEMCGACKDPAEADTCTSDAVSDAAKCGGFKLDEACGGSYEAVNANCPSDIKTLIKSNCGG